MKTVEDYQKRDAHVIKYLKEQIKKMELAYNLFKDRKNYGKLCAYKDMLFKMQTIEEERPMTVLEQAKAYGTYEWTKEQFEEYLGLVDWDKETKDYHRKRFTGTLTFSEWGIAYEDKPKPVSDREKTLLEMVDTDGTYTWTVEQFEEYLSLKDWSTATKMEHRLAFNGDITIEGNEIRYS